MENLLEPLLAVSGILITAYFSVKQFRKTRVAISDVEVYNFERETYNKFKDLKIIYNGIETTDKLTFIKGVIYLAGQNDIPKESIEQGITITGEDDTKFLDFKVLKSSHSFDIKNSGKAISVNTDIIKIDDYILFETVCENLNSPLKVEHRILNTADTIRVNYSSLKDSLKYFFLFLIVGGLFSFAVFGTSMFIPSGFDFETLYYKEGKMISIEAMKDNRQKFIEGWNNGIETTIKEIDSLAKDSLLPNDLTIRTLPFRLELLKKSDIDTRPALNNIEVNAHETIDSLIRSNNTVQLLWSKDYRKRFTLGDSFEVSFRLESFAFIIVGTIFLCAALLFLLVSILFLFQYVKYEVPLKKIIT